MILIKLQEFFLICISVIAFNQLILKGTCYLWKYLTFISDDITSSHAISLSWVEGLPLQCCFLHGRTKQERFCVWPHNSKLINTIPTHVVYHTVEDQKKTQLIYPIFFVVSSLHSNKKYFGDLPDLKWNWLLYSFSLRKKNKQKMSIIVVVVVVFVDVVFVVLDVNYVVIGVFCTWFCTCTLTLMLRALLHLNLS